ncbi:MAG: HEAT repeat domain-containing protein [Verrucomicrobia bacterium]|nr:HEAT repeat domain-containing protein [Verrucomicrobiota bacterium]
MMWKPTIRNCLLAATLALTRMHAVADDFDPSTASLENLLFHAQRYGNTAEKRMRKKAAQEELFARKTEALAYLMEHIDIDNMWIQILAYQLVVKLDKEDAVPVLLGFIDDPNDRKRKSAVYFLGFKDAPEHAERVAALLGDDSAGGAAVRTLGKWKAVDYLEDVAQFLTHDKERWRVLAANALRDIGDKRAIPYLREAEKDQYFTVRKAAERARRSLGDENGGSSTRPIS